MASASEIRAWARETGYDVTARGNIPGTVRDAYDAAHPSSNGAAGAGPDYPDDDFAGAFGGAGTAFGEPPDEEFDESAMREEAPRNPKDRPGGRARSRNTRGGNGGLFGRRGARRSRADQGKKRPRISTEDILGSLWRAGAKLATPLPPLQRTLRIQAPVAGMILDDAVKNTVADTVLQPLARLGGQAKVISALVGPPVLVTALSVHITQRTAAGQAPNPLLLSAGIEALRSSLMAWMAIAGPKMLIALEREQEFEDKYGQSVDQLIEFLLSAPVNPLDQEAVQAEEDAIRRAQGILGDG